MNFSETRIVFMKEIRDILRDRRTLVLMILLPLFSYPLIVLATAKALTARQHASETRVIKLGLINDDGTLRQYFSKKGLFQLVTISESDPNQSLRRGASDALLEVTPDFFQRLEEAGDAPTLSIRTKTESGGKEIVNRIENALQDFRADSMDKRLKALGVDDPWQRAMEVVTNNTASTQMRSGSWIGLTLPTALLMLIVIATAYPAFDMITGERERGTLSVLLTTPMSRHSIMNGKLLAISTVGLTTAFLLIASLFLTLHFGAPHITDQSGTFVFHIPLIGALLTFPMAVPLVIFLAAVSLTLSAYSHTLQQGQGYMVPLITVIIPLTGVTFIPSQSLPPIVNIIPIANVCLCIRDLLKGSYNWPAIAVTFASSTLYAYMLARYAVGLLDKEEQLFGIEVAPKKRNFTKLVAMYYAGSFLIFFSLGQLLQVSDPIWGMMASQGLLILLPAAGLVRWLNLPIKETMRLLKPHFLSVVGAVLLAPLTLVASGAIAAIQDKFLPMPESYAKALLDVVIPKGRPMWQIILAMAVTPGICEEIMFRGAILGLLRRSMPAVRAAVICGILFGCFHLSSYRLAPTALIGILFSGICLYTNSIFPSMLLHATHNSVTLLASINQWDVLSLPWLLASIPSTALGVFLMRTAKQTVRSQQQ